MKIEDLRCTTTGGHSRASATVIWEDCDRPRREIYFESEARFAADLHSNPDAFLLAAFAPAMRHGEARVQVEGKVCPKLRNGLMTAMQVLRHWYGEARHRPVAIEPTEGFAPPMLPARPRTASFFSGGVDAMATLRGNRLDLPLDHPGSIADGLFIHGLEVGGYEHLENNLSHFKLAVASLTELAKQTQLAFIPVRTNVRHLDDDDRFHFQEFYGAILASIAHAFSRRITTAIIASGSSVPDLEPIGSHPLLDPNYSSAGLAIEHDGIRHSRLEKVGLISQWPPALRALRSCFDPFRAGPALNCGKCEKCLRTMTELLVHGKLKDCPAYPLDDLAPTHLEGLIADPVLAIQQGIGKAESTQRERDIYIVCRSLSPASVYYWRELIQPLIQIRRRDLAGVIEPKLAQYHQFLARQRGHHTRASARERTKQRLLRFDQRFLGGNLIRIKRRLAGQSPNLSHEGRL